MEADLSAPISPAHRRGQLLLFSGLSGPRVPKPNQVSAQGSPDHVRVIQQLDVKRQAPLCATTRGPASSLVAGTPEGGHRSATQRMARGSRRRAPLAHQRAVDGASETPLLQRKRSNAPSERPLCAINSSAALAGLWPPPSEGQAERQSRPQGGSPQIRPGGRSAAQSARTRAGLP